MNKKLVLLLTLIVSFIYTISVRAEEVYIDDNLGTSKNKDVYNNVICYYDKGTTQWAIKLEQDYNGNKKIWHNKNTASPDSDEWTLIYGGKTKNYINKFEFLDVLYSNGIMDGQNKLKKCPPCVNYKDSSWFDNKKNIYFSYYNNKDKHTCSNGYLGLYDSKITYAKSADGKVLVDTKKSNNEDKAPELHCPYPIKGLQGELKIDQSTNGKLKITYKGKNITNSINYIENSGSNTGYNQEKGRLEKCPECADKNDKRITFANYNSDGNCDGTYSALESTDKDFTTETHICKYVRESDTSFGITLKFNETGANEITYDKDFSKNYQWFGIDKNFIENELLMKSNNGTTCPSNLYSLVVVDGTSYQETFSLEKSGTTIKYINVSEENTDEDTPEEPPFDPKNCNELLGDSIDIIQEVMKYIRIIIPILLLVFGVVDFFKAIFSGDSGKMVEDRNRFFKRIIAAMIAFIVPVFVTLVLKLAQQVWPEINPETCVDVQKEGEE